jgi:TolB-like protein/Flp pilus assembly protein TadD/tRNA A-37 threonylcarbamoyl transferase component Bud32
MADVLDRVKSALAARYAIERELGAGGMATVYLAEDLKLHRKVAVKVLKPELAAALGPDRFLQEIEIAAQLHHPHILPLFDSGEADGFLYYVMPYEAGQSLREKLAREGELPVADAVRILHDVVDALSHAHKHSVVHRDIKPDNVMLSDRHALVTDFGVAKAVSEATGRQKLTTEGIALGTPAYMSPEQAAADPHIDHRSDIYAVGAVAYELLTGRPPFTGTTQQEILAAHVTQAPEPVTKFRESVPPALEQLVLKCLKKKPADRWQSAEELLPHLEALATPSGGMTPTQTVPGAFAEVLTTRAVVSRAGGARWPVPRRWLGIGFGAVLSLLAAVIGARYLTRDDGGAEISDRSIAVLPFETLGQQEVTAFTDGVHGDVLTRLSSVSGLSVISRASVMRYRNPDTPPATIAQELGVTWILNGEVQEFANEVQVSARLVNARTDRQVWAQSYRRELTAANLFQIQGEITAEIARALETRLSPEEEQQVTRTPTQNLDAYRLYVHASGLLDQRTEAAMRQAVEYFGQAIARDSSYALSWAGLADALELLEDYGYAELGSLLPQAGDAARRAVYLDPDLAEAHTSLGMLHYHRRQSADAIRELKLAVELRASYAEAHNWLSWVQHLVGHPNDALKSATRAVELNPFSAEAVSNLSLSYLINGDEELALQEARRTQLNRGMFETGHFYEAVIFYHQGRPAEAKSILHDLTVPWAASGPVAILALAHVATGDTTRARELLDRLGEVDEPFNVGLVHAALGEAEVAFEAFQKVVRWGSWPTLAVRYLFPDVLGPLREDPRYMQLLDNLAHSWESTGGAR